MRLLLTVPWRTVLIQHPQCGTGCLSRHHSLAAATALPGPAMHNKATHTQRGVNRAQRSTSSQRLPMTSTALRSQAPSTIAGMCCTSTSWNATSNPAAAMLVHTCLMVPRMLSYSCWQAASSLRSRLKSAVSMGSPNLKYSLVRLGTGIGVGTPSTAEASCSRASCSAT